MAANRRSTWRLLAALLLLVTVPAAGSIPALPPPESKADLVSADLLDDVAGLEHGEILALVAFVVPEETPSWSYPHPKTRVWGSNFGGEAQPIGESWFRGEVSVGVLVVRFYHADGLGSVRALTDETGSVTDRWSFTAFGELLEHVGDDPNAYLFAGEPLDPNSGFYYNRARWMDPGVGRFVSVDPFGGQTADPPSLHRYLYTRQNPINLADPSGREYTGLTGLQVTALAVTVLAGAIVGYFIDRLFETVVTLGLEKFGQEEAAAVAPFLVMAVGVLFPDMGDVRYLGRLSSRGLDQAAVRNFETVFGIGFVRRVPGTGNIVRLRPGRSTGEVGDHGFLHILHRHVPDYWGGQLKPTNTQWPTGTSATDVLRHLDSAIDAAGPGLIPGRNDIILPDGNSVRLVLDGKFEVKTFHPLSWNGSFEMRDVYVAQGLL